MIRVLAPIAPLFLAACVAVHPENTLHSTPSELVSRLVLATEPSQPAIPYARFLDARGEVVDNAEFQAWARRAENLEAVYAEARGGNPKALRLVRYLELTFEGAGDWMAGKVTASRCLALPELQSDCHADWTSLDFVGKGPGGTRLRALAFEAYERRLWELEKKNQLKLAVFNALMAGMVWERTLAGAAVAEEGAALRRGLSSEELAALKQGAADLSVFVNEAEGLTQQVLEAKLAEVEAAAPGPRVAGDAAALARARPMAERQPPGVEAGDALWRRYVTYYEERLAELRRSPAGKVKPPRTWESYRKLREDFARGLGYQRARAEALRKDAEQLPALRRWLKDFRQPRVAQNVGVKKADLRYVDVFVYEGEAGLAQRIESFSFKSRDFGRMPAKDEWQRQIDADAAEAKQYYGGEYEVRRPSIKNLYGQRVKVDKVHLVYDAELKPGVDPGVLEKYLKTVQAEMGVEVRFE